MSEGQGRGRAMSRGARDAGGSHHHARLGVDGAEEKLLRQRLALLRARRGAQCQRRGAQCQRRGAQCQRRGAQCQRRGARCRAGGDLRGAGAVREGHGEEVGVAVERRDVPVVDLRSKAPHLSPPPSRLLVQEITALPPSARAGQGRASSARLKRRSAPSGVSEHAAARPRSARSARGAGGAGAGAGRTRRAGGRGCRGCWRGWAKARGPACKATPHPRPCHAPATPAVPLS